MPIDVRQIVKFSSDLRNGRNRLGKQVADVVRQQARAVETAAKSRVPVQTGALRNSIHVTTEGSGVGSSIAASVTTDLRYAQFVEYGTGRGPPQPFMGPALDAQTIPFYLAIEKAAVESLGGT
jgi:HK97 gp10 family phage protein